MSAEEVEVLVVGAGVAGLAAANELTHAGREVLLVDAADGPGGVARSDRVDGFCVERGPNTFRVKPPLAASLGRMKLADALVQADPSSRRRCVFRDGQLVPVPMDPVAFAFSPLISGSAKLQLLAEPFKDRGDARDESVHEFISRRLGPEVSTHLVGAFLTGVYAGDERQLSAAAVFPSLVSAERESGSIVRGLIAAALRRRGGESAKAWPGIWSGRDGVGVWTQRLAEALPQAPLLETSVTEISRDGPVFRVGLLGPSGESSLRARSLVLAIPANEAAKLLRGCCPEAAERLGPIEYAPIVGAAVSVTPGDVVAPIEGFGFIAPRAAGLGLLGCLFMNRLFPGRAPEGRELLHCMVGGVRWPESVDLPDDLLSKRVFEDLDRTLGLRGQPGMLSIRRTPRAVPQPGRGHLGRVLSARKRLRDLDRGSLSRLRLAGAYLDGVALPDAFASGLRAAAEILA